MVLFLALLVPAFGLIYGSTDTTLLQTGSLVESAVEQPVVNTQTSTTVTDSPAQVVVLHSSITGRSADISDGPTNVTDRRTNFSEEPTDLIEEQDNLTRGSVNIGQELTDTSHGHEQKGTVTWESWDIAEDLIDVSGEGPAEEIEEQSPNAWGYKHVRERPTNQTAAVSDALHDLGRSSTDYFLQLSSREELSRLEGEALLRLISVFVDRLKHVKDLVDVYPQTGEEGPTGDMGPPGDQGPMGQTGPAGDKGARGLKGLLGPPGPPGVDGPKGQPGDQGEMGPSGPQGPPGPRGPRGNAGPAGDKGPTGAKGPKGGKGLDGEKGPTGLKGPRGDTAPTAHTDPATKTETDDYWPLFDATPIETQEATEDEGEEGEKEKSGEGGQYYEFPATHPYQHLAEIFRKFGKGGYLKRYPTKYRYYKFDN